MDFFYNPSLPNINLTITAGYTGTTHAISYAPTSSGGHGVIGSLDTIITMNNAHPSSSRMNRCSQDTILSTIIHELIHTEMFYLNTRDGYVSYSNGNGGFDFMTDASQSSQHELMALARVDFIANILIENNSNLASLYGDTGLSVAYLMSWVGLTETNAFNNALANLPDNVLEAIEDVGKAANCEESESVINSFGFNMCPA